MEKKPSWTGPKKPNNDNNQAKGGRKGDKEKDGHAINEQITAKEVRLVGDNVEQGVYPIAEAMKKAGNDVRIIIGARTKDLIIEEDKMRALDPDLIIVTDDGSYGEKGVVTAPLKRLIDEGDVKHAVAIGPAIMMKFCTKTAEEGGVPITVSLNSIMIDGTGMCGGCRVDIGGEMKFVCVDGPEFDGSLVNWDNLMMRQRTYKAQEKEDLDSCKGGICGRLGLK